MLDGRGVTFSPVQTSLATEVKGRRRVRAHLSSDRSPVVAGMAPCNSYRSQFDRTWMRASTSRTS